jgi:hypothetical protein
VQPPTYTTVSREEMAALNAGAELAADAYSERSEPEPEVQSDLVAFVDPEVSDDGDAPFDADYEQHVYEQQQAREMSEDWREVRRQVGATRRPPRSGRREAA